MIVHGSHSVEAVLRAFAGAVSDIGDVARTATVEVKNRDGTPNYEYRHQTLHDVLVEVRRVCALHGLAVTQAVQQSPHEARIEITTTVVHRETAEWVTFAGLPIKAGGDPQATGSAVTYARRYALVTVFGIAADDDDGSEATTQARRPDGQRTDAEQMIRDIRDDLDTELRHEFDADFRDRFGVGLSDLPTNRHGDALGFAKAWRQTPTALHTDRVTSVSAARQLCIAAFDNIRDRTARAAAKTAFMNELGASPTELEASLLPAALHHLEHAGLVDIADKTYVDGIFDDEPDDS